MTTKLQDALEKHFRNAKKDQTSQFYIIINDMSDAIKNKSTRELDGMLAFSGSKMLLRKFKQWFEENSHNADMGDKTKEDFAELTHCNPTEPAVNIPSNKRKEREDHDESEYLNELANASTPSNKTPKTSHDNPAANPDLLRLISSLSQQAANFGAQVNTLTSTLSRLEQRIETIEGSLEEISGTIRLFELSQKQASSTIGRS